MGAVKIIAEFLDGADARNFLDMKGRDFYDVTPGINLPYAVRQKTVGMFDLGRSDQPPDVRVDESDDDDLFEYDDDEPR